MNLSFQQQTMLPLDISVLQPPLLPIDIPFLQQPVLPLDEYVCNSLCCPQTWLFFISLCCPCLLNSLACAFPRRHCSTPACAAPGQLWTCLFYSSLCCPKTYLFYSCLCYPQTCLFLQHLCYPWTGLFCNPLSFVTGQSESVFRDQSDPNAQRKEPVLCYEERKSSYFKISGNEILSQKSQKFYVNKPSLK